MKAPEPPGGERLSAPGEPLSTALEGPLFLELRRAQTELADFRALVENLRDVVFMSSPELEATYVNAAYEAVWGRSRESLYRSPLSWADAIHPDDRQRALQLERQGRENGWEVEYRVVRPDGTVRWVRSRGFPVRDARGRTCRFAGVAEDVTEHKQREAELLEAKEAAERASRAKSEFLANISHELRTPLNSILGFAEVLADGDFGALNERQTSYLEHIQASGRHLLELINDLLDLAKIEAKKTALDLAELDLESLLLDLVSSLAPMAEKAGISLAAEIERGMPAICADARRVRQVVYNLLSNALKFTSAGGRVRLTARFQPAVEGGPVESRFVVSVVDTGIGIGPEDQSRLFQVFEQVGDTSYARRHHGTGLGLALSRRLVEMHGGRIWAESAGEGRGSTFSFEIPAAREAATQAE